VNFFSSLFCACFCIFVILLVIFSSKCQVLIRLIGADEHMYVSHVNAMQWIEDTNVLEMIADKFSSSVSIISFLKSIVEDLDMLLILNLNLLEFG